MVGAEGAFFRLRKIGVFERGAARGGKQRIGAHVGEVYGGEQAVIGLLLGFQRGVTADTALRLARYFGGTPEFWLNLQSAFELRLARRTAGGQIEREVTPRAA